LTVKHKSPPLRRAAFLGKEYFENLYNEVPEAIVIANNIGRIIRINTDARPLALQVALLIPILAPSSRTDAPQGGAQRGHDWRPTLLAASMVVLFGAIMSLPLARWFYEIEPIPLADAVALGLISLVWALVVFAVRRLLGRAGT